MRLATFNVEWFADHFDRRDRPRPDDRPSRRPGVTRARQGAAVAEVLRAVDADAVMIVEAPNTGRTQNTCRALQAFARAAGLRTRRAVMGFASTTHQEIALLFDPDRLAAVHAPLDGGDPAPAFDGALDLDDGGPPVRFCRPPLELVLTDGVGQEVRLIGVHLKSTTLECEGDPTRLARARRIQDGEAIWLARRVVALQALCPRVIVLGDLNSPPGPGPGGGTSPVMRLVEAGLYDPHAQAGGGHRSARFVTDAGDRGEALLDYILVSPALRALSPVWRIWHPEDDARCRADPGLAQALRDASDHVPVSLDLPL